MKKLFACILAVALFVSAVPLGAFEFSVAAATEGYYTYKVVDNKATITSVSSNISGNVVIPSTLGGYTVTCIGENAFMLKSNIASMVIPNTVTTIEGWAFDSCSVTGVQIPNSVTSIGSYAFDSCYGLTSVIIPSSISSLSSGIFYGCKNLKTVVLPRSVTAIDEYAFYGCSGLTDVYYEGTEQQKNAIDVKYAYYNPGIENATWHYNSCPSNGTHKYDNNCDTNCNYCGATRTITHSYWYNSWVVTKEATCENAGSRYKVCSVCDYVYTEKIPAIGHNYIGIVTEPTCIEQGYKTYTCSMCNDSYTDNYVNALGHSFDNDFDAICNECGCEREAKIYGDVSGDSQLNNRDLALLMQYINGWNVTVDTDAADITLDGKINNKDYAVVMRQINGWDVGNAARCS